MSRERLVRASRFLSLVLRHDPARAEICDVEALLDGCRRADYPPTGELVEEVVASSDKKRFAFSPDVLQTRASQSHSVPVQLGFKLRHPASLIAVLPRGEVLRRYEVAVKSC